MYTLQAPKKSNGCMIFFAVIGVITVAIVGLFVIAILAASGTPTSASTVSRGHEVIYKITTDRDWGNCYGFDVTYEMTSGTAQKSVSICDGDTSTIVDQRRGHSGDFVYISVQNDEQSARISCEIYIDGKLVHKTYSDGQYVIASCSGSIP